MTKFNVIPVKWRMEHFQLTLTKRFAAVHLGKTETMIINMYSFKRMLNKTAKENTKARL